jgi:hypothetical protein
MARQSLDVTRAEPDTIPVLDDRQDLIELFGSEYEQMDDPFIGGATKRDRSNC